MEKTTCEKLEKQIIGIIKNCEICDFNEITLETNIKDVTNNDWIDFNILIEEIEEYLDIEINNEEIFYAIFDGTIKELIDCVTEIIDNNEEFNKLIKEKEAQLKENIASDIAIRKIRWSKEDEKSYENPDY